MNPDLSPGLSFRHYAATEARALRSEVRLIFQGSYLPAEETGDDFASTEAFMHRFDTYTDPSRPRGFELVVAWYGDEPVGQAWGWPLSHDTGWWSGLQLDEVTCRLLPPRTATAPSH